MPSDLVQRLRNLHAHSGDPDTVAEAATTLENLEGVRAERDVLQEIVDEQRAQIAKLVERIVELTEEVSSVTEDRRHAVAALSEQVDTARAERDALFVLTDRFTAEHDALRAERDEVRQSYCSLMEAYRGGDGRVTANKLGWGYLFEEDKPCQ